MVSQYDTLNPYDGLSLYDTGGGIVIVANTDVGWQAVLNQLAGTKNLGENAAANAYAGTSNLGILAALNTKAGTNHNDITLCAMKLRGPPGLRLWQPSISKQATAAHDHEGYSSRINLRISHRSAH